MRCSVLVLLALSFYLNAIGCGGSKGHSTPADLERPRAVPGGGGEVPSPELQAELVAQLHSYIGGYTSILPGTLDELKELKVTGVTLSGADDRHVYVRFSIHVRAKRLGHVVYTVSGRARGRFTLGEFTANSICIAPPAGGAGSSLEVTHIEFTRMSGADMDGAANAIRSNFPHTLCVPLYPTITIANAAAEEAVALTGNRGLISNTLRFTVTLSNLSAREVSVRYRTADGTAASGMDYTSTSNMLAIPSLSATGTIGVRLKHREGAQGDRSFFLILSDPANAIITTPQATGLIIDYPDGR